MDECTAKNLVEEWDAEQMYLFSKLITSDTEPWQLTKDLKLVGGFDLSFFKEEPSRAVATLVVCTLPGLEVVYEDSNCISLFHPYIPGYLAFREAGPCLEALTKLKQTYPDLYPQVLLVDGNGILHPRGLGLASHVGILADLPTIGVAKNLYQMEELARNQEHKAKIQALEAGCHFPIIRQGKTLGAVLRTVVSSYKPVYVSIGHKISLETALHCVKQCGTKYRIPHPLRESDIRSRAFVRRLLN